MCFSLKGESNADGTPEQLVSPGRPDMKAPAPITGEQPASKNPFPPPPSKADAERNTEAARPTPARKPAAPQKPSLPPKKPLPKSKKPDVAAKKAEMKMVHPDKKGTVNDDAKSEGKSKLVPVIKAENADEGT